MKSNAQQMGCKKHRAAAAIAAGLEGAAGPLGHDGVGGCSTVKGVRLQSEWVPMAERMGSDGTACLCVVCGVGGRMASIAARVRAGGEGGGHGCCLWQVVTVLGTVSFLFVLVGLPRIMDGAGLRDSLSLSLARSLSLPLARSLALPLPLPTAP